VLFLLLSDVAVVGDAGGDDDSDEEEGESFRCFFRTLPVFGPVLLLFVFALRPFLAIAKSPEHRYRSGECNDDDDVGANAHVVEVFGTS
jgi:hypothetical protein